MKRISYWFLSTVSAVVLLFGFDASQHASSTTSASSVVSGTSSGSTTSGSAGSGSTGSSTSRSSGTGSTGSTSSSSGSSTAASTKTVTGTTASTQWGPVQVQLTVASGKITRVSVLQYPSGNGRDEEINGYALPILIQETLKDQSASIDMVSGATVTSTGYLQSLQSAIDSAQL